MTGLVLRCVTPNGFICCAVLYISVGKVQIKIKTPQICIQIFSFTTRKIVQVDLVGSIFSTHVH